MSASVLAGIPHRTCGSFNKEKGRSWRSGTIRDTNPCLRAGREEAGRFFFLVWGRLFSPPRHSPSLTDILYQRDREFIAFARPDLAVSGMGSSFAAQAAEIRAMSAA